MWPMPQTRFQWREPSRFSKALSRYRAATEAWWVRPTAFAVPFVVLVAAWSLTKPRVQHPASLSAVLALASLGGAFAAYLLPWLVKWFPYTLMVLDNRIVRAQGSALQVIKFEKVASFSVAAAHDFRVLTFDLNNGRRVFVGVPTEINVAAVSAFLEQKGVRREPTNHTLQWTGPAERSP